VPENNFDLVIIGGGAAGLAAAVFAGRRKIKTAVFEQLPSPGRKLLSTGGGHCNITNTASREYFYDSFGRNGRFIAPAMENFDNNDLSDFFKNIGVALHSTDGFHKFPKSGKATEVLQALLNECERLKIPIFTSSRITGIIISDGFVRAVSLGEREVGAKNILIATGGLSYPELGSTGDGYNLAKIAGHSIVEPVPALVELYCEEKWLANLSGVSLKDVEISVPKSRIRNQRGEFLFTHNGMSGPAALNISGDISALLLDKNPIEARINFFPFKDSNFWTVKFAEWRHKSGNTGIVKLLSEYMPKSLAQTFCELSSANFAKASQIASNSQKKLLDLLTGAPVHIKGNAGFGRAMLTKGGVSLKEVDPRSLESKIVKGLFFAGELLDVQGPCGGFNLQWAFSSANLATKSI